MSAFAAGVLLLPVSAASAADEQRVTETKSKANNTRCAFSDNSEALAPQFSPAPFAPVSGTDWVRNVQKNTGEYCRRFRSTLETAPPSTVAASHVRLEIHTPTPVLVRMGGFQVGVFGPSMSPNAPFIATFPVPAVPGPATFELEFMTGNSPVHASYRATLTQIIDRTAPQVSARLVGQPSSGGWFKAAPTIEWQALDPSPGTGVVGPLPTTVANLEGDQLYTSPSICDRAGNCATGSARVRLDTVNPVVTPTVVLASPNEHGWYDQPVYIDWRASDATSGVASQPEATRADLEGENTYSSPPVCDVAGNCVTASLTIRIDTETPTVVANPDRVPDHGDWYHGPVTIEWVARDLTSGIVEQPEPTVADIEGQAAYGSGAVCDFAGHCTSDIIHVWIDSADPEGSVTSTGLTVSTPLAPAGVSGTASDSTSGVDSVRVTYTGTQGSVSVDAPVTCAPTGVCTWNAAAPDEPGLYATSVVITDAAGRSSTLAGPQMVVVGLPAA